MAVRDLLALLITSDEFLEQAELNRVPTALTLFVVVTLAIVIYLAWRYW